ncbi:MAG: hypothetical protein ACXVQX_11795 [Actinomycetota bacterium]
MGIAYRCDSATGLSVEVWDGEVSAAQAHHHIEQLAADPQWSESRRLVTDLTSMAAESRPTPEQLAGLADVFLQELAYLVGDVKWSVIAEQAFDDALGFGAHIKHEVRRMIVFNSLATATVWLGLDPSDVQPVIDGLRRRLRGESR